MTKNSNNVILFQGEKVSVNVTVDFNQTSVPTISEAWYSLSPDNKKTSLEGSLSAWNIEVTTSENWVLNFTPH